MTAEVHFSISGEFITKHARNLIFEKNWENAVQFLKTSIQEIAEPDIHAILSGQKRFKGVNDLYLIDETKTAQAALQKRLNWFFSGTIFDGLCHYRPYAYIGNPSATHIRSRKSDRIVRLLFKDQLLYTIWERVEKTPPWFPIASAEPWHLKQWQESLEQYLTVGRKAFEQYDWTEEKELIDEDEVDDTPVEDEQLAGNAGWILRDGRFFSCSFSGHIELSARLQDKLFKRDTDNPERDAETDGWVKVCTDIYFTQDHAMLHYFSDLPVTKAQQLTVAKWSKKHKLKLPLYWIDKLERE